MIRLRVYDVDSETGRQWDAGEIQAGGGDGLFDPDPPCLCQQHRGQDELARLDDVAALAAAPAGGGVATP